MIATIAAGGCCCGGLTAFACGSARRESQRRESKVDTHIAKTPTEIVLTPSVQYNAPDGIVKMLRAGRYLSATQRNSHRTQRGIDAFRHAQNFWIGSARWLAGMPAQWLVADRRN